LKPIFCPRTDVKLR